MAQQVFAEDQPVDCDGNMSKLRTTRVNSAARGLAEDKQRVVVATWEG